MLKDSWKPEKNSSVPLYEQIKNHIRERISEGDWKIGSRIPTQRQLAEFFDVNRSTVVTAIEDLIAEGLLEGRTKGGTTVKNNTWSLLSNKPAPDWKSYVRSGTHQPNFSTIQLINKYEFDPGKIRLGTGELSPKLFPKRLMSIAAERFVGEMNSLGYEEPKGSQALRKCICDYLRPRGIKAEPSQVLIVSGALQALHLISVGILYKGSTILTENPSYIYSINVFQSAGMKLFGIPMDHDGIMVDKVLKHRRQTNAAMLYTIPSFHNPTGISMGDERRRLLLEACENERLPIIEDDVYRELYIDGAAPVPIKALDKNEQVLYLGSLSKTLCPGLRIGWVVGQEAVIDRLADIKMQTDYGSSSISQAAATEFIASGLYEEYTGEIREELRIRRDITTGCLSSHFSDIAEWESAKGGFYVWLCLKKPVSMQRLFNECLAKGILINPGNLYQHMSSQHIRLSYSYASYEELESGLKTLSETIREIWKDKV